MSRPSRQPWTSLVEDRVGKVLMRVQVKEPPVPIVNLYFAFAKASAAENASNYEELIAEMAKQHFVNCLKCSARFNEACAAELGRLCLGYPRPERSHLTPRQLLDQNHQIHWFQKCVLMPDDMLREACGNFRLAKTDLSNLGKLFAVTQSFVSERLIDMSIHFDGEELYKRDPYF